MPKLVVNPVRTDEPGSWWQRRQIIQTARAVSAARDRNDMDALFDQLVALDDLFLSRVATDDGSPVEPLLRQLSIDEYEVIMQALMGGESVPTTSGEPSPSGHGEAKVRHRTGRKPS